MKKIITLCLFAFAMFIGNQTVFAQASIVEVNRMAAEKTKELRASLKFDQDTEDLVYQTYQEYAKKQIRYAQAEADGKVTTEEQKEKLENWLTEKFKGILTPEQFEKFLNYAKRPK
ncbi:MAG TPA: hypothetical protein PKL92_02905 [Aquaticitalea sp.]|nr:hypothetical protein [Aquaticitalea sp.]HNU60187.1 hypothetical protein [Aquaticitalea sp.]